MKLRYFVLIVLFGCSVGAKEAQELFLEANQLYEQADYQEALERYAEIKNKGSAVHYNVGNTFYRLGHYTKALVAYHRAQAGASGAQLLALAHNVRATHDKLGRAPAAPMFAFIGRQVQRVPFLLLQLLLVVAWCFLLYRFWYLYERKQCSALLGMVAFIALLLGMVHFKYKTRLQVCALVMKEATLRVGPNEQFHARGVVQVGHQVHIVNEQQTNDGVLWYRVQQADQNGWLPAEQVEVI